MSGMRTDDEYQSIHTYELDPERWIQVEVTRRWPKYVASWSIRQRSGDSDFPITSGEVERMPPRDGAELEEALDSLRDEARKHAMSALPPSKKPSEQRKGLFNRLFGG